MTPFSRCFYRVKGGVKAVNQEKNGRNACSQYRVTKAIMANQKAPDARNAGSSCPRHAKIRYM
jgi:hypothetical protein